MKLSIFFATLLAAAVSASAVLEARDTCGAGYGGDQRRTNSACEASNGDRHFCGCDRTDIVECQNGVWTEVTDCGSGTCHGGNDGGAQC